MTMFEYVMVLVSIIVGLGLTHLLQGILDLIQERVRSYWVHLVWVGWTFIQAIFWWWWEFRFSEVEAWTFPLFLFVIGYAFLLYLACGFLFPKSMEAYGDFKTYFYARRRWFFGVLVVFFSVDLADTALKGMDYFRGLGPEYVIATPVLLAGALTAAWVRNERYHQVYAVFMFVYQLSWALRFFYQAA